MTTLCIPTLTRYDTLERCVVSAMDSSLPPDQIYIIDNGRDLTQLSYCDTLLDYTGHERLNIHTPDCNLGVAGSWNYFFNNIDEDFLIICNDDVVFHCNTIKLLAHAVLCGGGFVCPESHAASNAWSCFAQTYYLWREIGPYDEQFWPAYYEDNDYGRRMLQSGNYITAVPGCSYDHIGSATLKSYSPAELEQHHQRFRANQARYIAKWGGLPGDEKFITPYTDNR